MSDPVCDLKSNKEFYDIHQLVKAHTVTSIERQYALYQSVNYILDNDIRGDIVECGVYKGGSMMLVAKMLADRGITDRKLVLFDMFEDGMTLPGPRDIPAFGVGAAHFAGKLGMPPDVVLTNIYSTGFKGDVEYHKGDVLDTTRTVRLGGKMSPTTTIALLRLDTDWYESTKVELENLYPFVNLGGIVIFDDYGHWLGSQQAVDEYFKSRREHPFLHRMDYSGRYLIKL